MAAVLAQRQRHEDGEQGPRPEQNLPDRAVAVDPQRQLPAKVSGRMKTKLASWAVSPSRIDIPISANIQEIANPNTTAVATIAMACGRPSWKRNPTAVCRPRS